MKTFISRNSVTLFILLLTISSYSQTTEEYINRGLAKHNQEDYIGALQDFTKAIELNPQYAVAYFNRGAVKGTWGIIGANYRTVLRPSSLILSMRMLT